jgi:hypothetical protein
VVTGHGTVTLDFLIPPSSDSDVGGTLRDIERDFAAIITPSPLLRIDPLLLGRNGPGEKHR